ncbi:conserved membrane hypothetical protein [uncultured delta proteobacterium]|uniref:Uncharacterized protein n=1 Tax=uncultured delta proteobacterium TaxID=34034 RepID=A0A212J9I1_9DELT|nr:conserved membrane hypothetical protein [uncultured delta proteobacterium]
MNQSPLHFDKEDYDLLEMVNDILTREQKRSRDEQLFAPELHPHGIKEMAVAREILVAYSVINLLDSLEAGEASDRILALRSLHDEVLYTAASSFRYNTGRVLIQIMKDLVRAHGDEDRQLMLARDFRAASTGKRRIIRAMLKRYHLLEMPEDWDQLTFDNHVHDANTKGRKTPTHLIMDAWIKGLKQLTVIHYNFVEPRAVQELMQAAEIMGIDVRIGVEFKARFRGRYIDFIWEPIGLDGAKGMTEFLEEDAMRQLMHDGRSASAFMAQYVFSMLERYNAVHREDLAALFGIGLPVISLNEFLAFVAAGQPSLEHLAELIYKQMFPLMHENLPRLREQYANAATEEERAFIKALVKLMRDLHPELIMESYFTPAKNPDLLNPEVPSDVPETPEFLKTTAQELVARLNAVRPMSRIILTLSGLRTEDALELLYTCEGRITHLELFNLKDFVTGKMPHYKPITELMYAINQGSAFVLKRMIRGIIRDYSEFTGHAGGERRELLTKILRNIPRLQSFYKKAPLKTRVGSDSTSRSYRLHGMGFAFIASLPKPSQKSIRDPKDFLREVIPLRTEIDSVYTYSEPAQRGVSTFKQMAGKFLRKIPGFSLFGCNKKHSWVPRTSTTRHAESKDASIATLGGFQREMPDVIHLETREGTKPKLNSSYLNTKISNSLKVLVGFSLTLAVFSFTQQWWVLAWFGAPIWFAITGLRNIVQSVLGGGGLRRTPLLRWNDYVSWSRICDSLLYTGISVPLLELVLRWGVLGQVFGITAVTNPVLFYTIISAANGMYIASHNLYRGLPREAIVGNLFRSVLAIPLALVYNTVLITLVTVFDVSGGLELLIAGSAIVSKAASDTVAGVIEGIGDQNTNLRTRNWDYTYKLSQLFSCLARLEVLLPEEDVLDLLRKDKDRQPLMAVEIYLLQDAIIIHSLDLMYFWMYQPRARTLLTRLFREMTVEERTTFVLSQAILVRTKEISRMFVDGILGNNFSKPLAFFLDSHAQYLADISQASGVRIPEK